MAQSQLEIRFYHLKHTSVEAALVRLLSVCVNRGWHALVVSDSDAFLETIDATLWLQEDFIPHAVAGQMHQGKYDALNPILLCNTLCNDNNPHALFLLHEADTNSEDKDNFVGAGLVCHLFDGRDGDNVNTARTFWKRYLDRGYHLTYWQQDNKTWVKKSESNIPQFSTP